MSIPPIASFIDKALDVTAPSEVEVVISKSAGGHDVLYVHVEGLTLLRVCRFGAITINDRRNKPHGRRTKTSKRA